MNDNVLIIVSLISIAGSILITQLLQMNWFKRENFKFNQSTKRKEYNINFKNLERKLNLQQSAPLTEEKGLLDSLKGLDLNKVQSMLQMVQKPEDQGEEDLVEYDEEQPKSIPDQLINFATQNPEIAQKFLSNLNLGGGEEGSATKTKYLGDP